MKHYDRMAKDCVDCLVLRLLNGQSPCPYLKRAEVTPGLYYCRASKEAEYKNIDSKVEMERKDE